MSDDLVKRLREASRQYVDNQYNLQARAADRIEQLEAALRNVLLWADRCQQCDYDDDWAIIEGRAR
ncbi:MAG: hypothetical protein EB015_12345, partial [Methylocystaceae bacterium]|nr:hypothetical protein [Methylocystaceae bacterium]